MQDTQQHIEVICATCEGQRRVFGAPGDLCPIDGGVFLQPKYLEELSSDLLLGEVIGGSYAVFAHIGRGSMGSVYKAKHTRLGRLVAIKTIRTEGLNPEETEEIKGRFLREAKALSDLRHTGIVTVYDYGEHDGKLYMILEFVRGESLWHRLAKVERLSVDRVVSILRQLLDSISEIHRIGIVHRDIKPSNVMLDMTSRDEERVVLIDFGVAKLTREDGRAEVAPITQRDVVVGTPKYMAPEQLLNEPLGPWTDIYAVGVMLYRMLSGQTPFTGRRADIVAAHLRDPAPPLPAEFQLSAFDPVIAKAMHKDPTERFADTGTFVSALVEGWVNATGNESVRVTQPLKIVQEADMTGSTTQHPRAANQLDATRDDASAIAPVNRSTYSDIERQELLASEASQSSWRGAVVGPPSEVAPTPKQLPKPLKLLGTVLLFGVLATIYIQFDPTPKAMDPLVITQVTTTSPPQETAPLNAKAEGKAEAEEAEIKVIRQRIPLTPPPSVVASTLGDQRANIDESPKAINSPKGTSNTKRLDEFDSKIDEKTKRKGSAKALPEGEQPAVVTVSKPTVKKKRPQTKRRKRRAATKSRRTRRPIKRKRTRQRRAVVKSVSLRKRQQAALRPTKSVQKTTKLTRRFGVELSRCDCSASKKTLDEIKRSMTTPAKELKKRYTMACGIVGLGCLSREKKPKQ